MHKILGTPDTSSSSLSVDIGKKKWEQKKITTTKPGHKQYTYDHERKKMV